VGFDSEAHDELEEWLHEPIGAGAVREIVYVAGEPGADRITLELRPGWDSDADATAVFDVDVLVRPPHSLEGVSSVQLRRHAERLAA
jgi:hypothetical protein